MNRTQWTRQEFELFAAYTERRAAHRPLECDHGTVCWVREGPPAIAAGNAGRCAGCRGTVRALDGRSRDAAGRYARPK